MLNKFSSITCTNKYWWGCYELFQNVINELEIKIFLFLINVKVRKAVLWRVLRVNITVESWNGLVNEGDLIKWEWINEGCRGRIITHLDDLDTLTVGSERCLQRQINLFLLTHLSLAELKRIVLVTAWPLPPRGLSD